MIEGVKNMAELTRDIVKGCNIVKKDGDSKDYLFEEVTTGEYCLKEDYDKIAEENIFGNEEFNLKKELEGVQKINFNKVKFIYENAFQLVKFEESDLKIQFEPEKKEVKIEPGAFGENFKVKKIIGKDDTNLLLYKSSFANFSDIEFENINLYLRGDGWTEADKGELINKEGIKELFDRDYNNLKVESNQKNETSVKDEAKTESTEAIVLSVWENLGKNKRIKVIKSIIEELNNKNFTIAAHIDIDKAKIKNDKLVLKGEECFDGDIKLVNADASLVDILKSVCEKNNLKNDPKNRNSVKKDTKEYIKKNWGKVTENNKQIETSITVTKGSLDYKKEAFLLRNKTKISLNTTDASDISDQLERLKTTTGNSINKIMKTIYILGKEYKKKDKEISKNCKIVIRYIQKNCMNKGEGDAKFDEAKKLWEDKVYSKIKGSSDKVKDGSNNSTSIEFSKLVDMIKSCEKIYSNYKKSYISLDVFTSKLQTVNIFESKPILILIFGRFDKKDSMHNVTTRVKREMNDGIISSAEKKLGDFKNEKFKILFENESYEQLENLKEQEVNEHLKSKLKKYLKLKKENDESSKKRARSLFGRKKNKEKSDGKSKEK